MGGDLVRDKVLHHLSVVKGDIEKINHIFVMERNADFYPRPCVKINYRWIQVPNPKYEQQSLSHLEKYTE